MARYQKVKPEFEDPKLKLAKQRERTKQKAQFTWIALIFIGIFAIFLGGEQTVLVGVCSLVMGAACLGLGALCLYSLKKRWITPTLFLNEANMTVSKTEREREQKEHRVLLTVELIALCMTGVMLVVVGILYLCGVL